ncbi:MAG: UDP-N-acetylmuramoyl-L-alanine--D-glutamate ligase [Phycisphaerales bacterium]|nr:UDP-N-acetylmuramoyl-L-alanine--D-glutamate ligase [Phycisphaerales bacterium]
MDSMRDLRTTVMGLGRFGGGLGVTRWLAEQGAHVTVTDLADEASLEPQLEQLQDLITAKKVTLRLGGHHLSDFNACDLVIANPAVPRPWDNVFLKSAQEAGIPITTEIRLVTERLDRQRVIGVTGSAGKSTTAAMIHHVLKDAGFDSRLGGNYGGSLLTNSESLRDADWIVLELSSAMLYWLDAGVGFETAPGYSPHIAVTTNVSPNHLDWHGSFEHYQASKQVIWRSQTESDHHIKSDDQSHSAIALSVVGEHNQMNAATALQACHLAAGMAPDLGAASLLNFRGLPHRLELVWKNQNQRAYNDSKSTTPQATCLAVSAFSEPKKVHLIAGGYDKGIDLSSIAQLATDLAGLYTIGTTGPKLTAMANEYCPHAYIESCHSVEVAVAKIRSRMGDDDVALLSPGCASWDQFDNFEQRGQCFIDHLDQGSKAPISSSTR